MQVLVNKMIRFLAFLAVAVLSPTPVSSYQRVEPGDDSHCVQTQGGTILVGGKAMTFLAGEGDLLNNNEIFNAEGETFTSVPNFISCSAHSLLPSSSASLARDDD